jgi:hypothetical protein
VFSNRFLRGAALLLVASFAACGDDDGGPTVLPAPTNVTATSISASTIRISWAAVTGASSYLVQRAPTGGVFSTLSSGIAATQYEDATPVVGTSYSYRVAAVAGADTSAFSTTVGGALGLVTINADITTNKTLDKDTVYVLSGYVKVTNNATLMIEAGTRILGDTVAGSSLWILRGSKIVANGTAAEPIVFTSRRAVGSRAPGDWGGIIVIGNGIINRSGTVNTEGPAGEAENYGGGTNNADSSGVLRYVRIEFAGYDVSGGGGSELNGLSMYAVGSKTVLEYVEVLAGLDDSFEFWGGAVDGRYLVSYESGDDHFDWSEGYVGRVQHAIAFQTTRLTPTGGTGQLATDPQGFEADGCQGGGCDNGFRSVPYPDPTWANVTIIGMGATETQAAGGIGAVIRRGTKGLIHNAIIGRWKGTGITVRDSVTGNILAADSLNLTDVVFAENTRGNYDTTSNFGQSTNFTSDNHRTATTVASIITNLTPASLDWKPTGIAASGCGTIAIPASRAANFFGGTMSNTAYCGAVDPAAGAPWYQGWTSHAIN